jgi:hypothetical protein
MVLERVVQKLALLSEFTVAKGPVDEERMKGLGSDVRRDRQWGT